MATCRCTCHFVRSTFTLLKVAGTYFGQSLKKTKCASSTATKKGSANLLYTLPCHFKKDHKLWIVWRIWKAILFSKPFPCNKTVEDIESIDKLWLDFGLE